MRKLKKLMWILLIALLLTGTTAIIMQSTTQTVQAAMKKGWVKTGKTFYYYNNGKKVKGWKTISKKGFYFDNKGKMVTGWKKLNGNYVYFKASGNKAVKGQLLTGWQTIKGKRFYFKKAGTNGSKTKKLTGWQTIKGKTYYFDKKKTKLGGFAYIKGTFTIDGAKCTFDKNGVLIKKTTIAVPTKKPIPTTTPRPTATPIPKPTIVTNKKTNYGIGKYIKNEITGEFILCADVIYYNTKEEMPYEFNTTGVYTGSCSKYSMRRWVVTDANYRWYKTVVDKSHTELECSCGYDKWGFGFKTADLDAFSLHEAVCKNSSTRVLSVKDEIHEEITKGGYWEYYSPSTNTWH